MKIDSFVIRWSKRNRYSRCIDPSRVTRSAQAWWNMNFEEGISMRRCAFAFRSVLRTRRDDNMLTYTHQMRGERKRKREWKTEIGRKEGEGGGKYWYELWISIPFDAKRLITWAGNAKRTESETEETHFHRDANISTSLQTCLGFNLKIFLVYATHECTAYN